VTAFQSYNVSVVDSSSGHSLREIPTTGDQAGMAVSPDGTRLYIVDGQGADDQLRVFDTTTWHVIHHEALHDRAQLLGGNPIALSGDGHWLVIAQYNYAREQSSLSVFDTRKLEFVGSAAAELQKCQENVLPVRLIGREGQDRLYGECRGYITAWRADTLMQVWKAEKIFNASASIALTPDGKLLYALYPDVAVSYATGAGSVTKSDLYLFAWDSATGNLVQQINLNDQVAVPTATFGRGGAGYLDIAPDGAHLYVAWEGRLWELSSNDLRVVRELKLPAPADGLAPSVDGRELYLLPSTAGDLVAREHGLWTVDIASFKLTRRASDWSSLSLPFMFAAPAPK
jgi:DNA-binding beta-propeller fold protein YncE